MSWESVEEWPSNVTSGVYRGAAEIIVAERSGLTLIERVVLWWHSTTELPFTDIAQDVVVTPSYVYVRKQDGAQTRVRREVLAQGRVEGRRRQYSVPNGTDMVLSDRNGDDVERALMDKGIAQGWTGRPRWTLTLAILIGLIGMAMFISDEHLREGAQAVTNKRYNSESAYWFYACLGVWVIPVTTFFCFPRRLIVDAIGLRSVRGFFGGIRSTIPIEDIRFVEVQHQRARTKSRTLHSYPVFVLVHTAKGFGKKIKLRHFDEPARHQAIEFCQMCATTWNVEFKNNEHSKAAFGN
ncbi:MAG: hypothetical protein ACI9KE_002883 [Polyangiales bacterium]|jgi:hypothetical protein